MSNNEENSSDTEAVCFRLQIKICSKPLKGAKSLNLNSYQILASGILPQLACRVWIRVQSSLLCKLLCKTLGEREKNITRSSRACSHHMLMPHLCTLSELDLRLTSAGLLESSYIIAIETKMQTVCTEHINRQQLLQPFQSLLPFQNSDQVTCILANITQI